MAEKDFFTSRQHYDFGSNGPAPQNVKRKDSIEADGRHKVELTLSLDSKEAQQAVLLFFKEIDKMHEIKTLEKLSARINWLMGYIKALHTMEAIDEEQAENMADILRIAAIQQGKVFGVTDWQVKE